MTTSLHAASRASHASLRHPAFVVVTAIQFVNVLVNGSTTMALPSIQSGLGATNSNLQWFAALFALAFALVLVPAGRLGDGWPAWIFVMLASAAPVFVAFVAYERRVVRRGGSPLVNPDLFRIPTFRVGNTITLLVGLVAAALPLYLILTVQIGFGKDAFQAALIACPMPLANMAGSLVTAPLLRRVGRLTVVIGAGSTTLAAGALLLAVAPGAGSVDVIALVPGFALVGFALGISIAAVIAIVLSDVPPSDAGSAAGVQSTGLQLSSAIGIAVYGVAFYGAVGASERLQPYLDGLELVMWVTIACSVVQAVLVLGLPRHSAREQGELALADPELLVFPDLHGDDGTGT